MGKSLLFLLVIFALGGCIEADRPREMAEVTDKAIVGGQELLPKDPLIKTVALVMYDKGEQRQSICTGTFISPQVVLTAAHCLPAKLAPELVSIKQTHDSNAIAEALSVSTYVIHPDYRGNIKGDLALVKLKKRQKEVQFASFLSTRPSGAYAWEFTAVGFGVTTGIRPDSEDPDNGILRSVQLWAGFYEKDMHYFTADLRSGRGICFGDSGGPALVSFPSGVLAVFGIASGVQQPEEPEDPCRTSAQYVNVEHYQKWLVETVKSLDPHLKLPDGF